METAYATALWKTVEEGMTPAKAVRALEATLKAHGREALLPRIASAFGRIAERESKRSGVVLTLAREKDERRARKEALNYLQKIAKSAQGGPALGRDLKTQIDDTLIGGWRLEGKETLVDASYKRALVDLYARVTN